MSLLGRTEEINRLAAMISDVSRGGALVLRGDAGIGKSALLAEAAGRARAAGFQVLTMSGVPAEARLPFSGLHQSLRPVVDRFDVLPAIQRDVLRAALGLSDETVPDVSLVGLAVLNLLVELAENTPVLLVAEDAHWLDAATADVLAFLARRVPGQPILLLAAARTGSGTPLRRYADLPELAVGRLSPAASAGLLDRSAGDLPAPLRQRLLAESAGNPLALVELPAAVRGADRLTALATPWLPVTERLEQAFVHRVTALPARTAALLQVAALSGGDDRAEIEEGARRLTGQAIGPADLEPALGERLVEVADGRLTFRHPLIRSAIHRNAGPGRRREVHRVLAEVLADQPDRQAWHLASTTDGPDEAIAAGLEEVAARAQRRGSVAGAVVALERAAGLTADPRRRADRLLRAAEAGVESGHPEAVDRLLDLAAGLDLTTAQRARAAWIRGVFDDGMRDLTTDAETLVGLAGTVAADGDVPLAVRILWSAALRCFWSDADARTRHLIVDAAERLPLDPLDAPLLAILAHAAPLDRGAVVIERTRRLLARPSLDAQTVRMLGTAAVMVGTFDVALGQSTAALPGLRAQGRLQQLARALAVQAAAAVETLDLAVAVPAGQEGTALAAETGQPYMLALIRANQAKLAALRGDHDSALRLAREAEEVALPVGARPVLVTSQYARALAALGRGDYQQALDRILCLHDPGDPSYHSMLRFLTIGDLAEAAVRCLRCDEAASIVAEAERAAAATTSPSLHDSLRLARALLETGDRAEKLYLSALAEDLTGRPYARGRLELAYGEWLRRHRRVAESRRPLRAARDTFDALGALPWGDRARRELQAAGVHSGERPTSAADRLTAHEIQIAQLAAEGLTNRDIGKRLYISHRTVGAHLASIFPKLGITARSQLHGALRQS